MSTALRIASVTQVLKDLLNNGLIDHDVTGSVGGNVNVTSWPPDKIETATDKEISQLNLFMYQVTYNQGWRNANLPSFNANGERVSNPPLAIDLHYLLTAYGSAELHTDILLGYGMQLFHETPVLDRKAIGKSIGPPSLIPGSPPVTQLPASLKLLSTSALAEQVEQIRITPEVLSIEDISKLWAAFGAKYRPTAAYKATVVLIESSRPVKKALPVKDRNVYVQPFKQPVIDKILSQSAPGQPVLEDQKILSGYKVFVMGNELYDEYAEITVDGSKVIESPPVAFENTQIAFTVPAGLSAGIHEVQVVHPVMMGSPPALHNGVMSVPAFFMLSPAISLLSKNITTDTIISGVHYKSGTVSFTISPEVKPGQQLTLFLNEKNNTTNPAAYSFLLSSSFPLPATAITVDISAVRAADYLVRVQVDGADSPVKQDINGKYDSPSINI